MHLDDFALNLTVVMPSIPEREELRKEAIRSVEDQTIQPAALLIEIDHNHRGAIPTTNHLASQVTTDWLLPFADDDLMDPNHIQTLTENYDGQADVVYSWCRVTGGTVSEDRWQIDPADRGGVTYKTMSAENWIPASAAISMDLWRYLGGYHEPSPNCRHEDWDFWLRALDSGARFQCVPHVTWTYRLGNDWSHLSLSGRTPAGQFDGEIR